MVLTVVAALSLLRQTPPPELFRDGTGTYHRKVSTKNRQARSYFDQGLAMLYAFHKEASMRSFEESARLDPGFALAHWGVAMANGPDINFPAVSTEASKISIAALARAQEVARPGTETELVAATKLRFADPAPEDRKKLDQAYSDAMGKLYAKHPNDPEIASLYAESILILSPWHQWEPDGRPRPGTLKAVKVLKHALRISPDHLMANHLWIHTVEASPHPEQALVVADKLRRPVRRQRHQLVQQPLPERQGQLLGRSFL